MKLAIMQPYFFPYVGYWQLIYASDCLVLLDDVQYIKHGWINRNRILKPGGGWQYIIVPVKKHAQTASIKDVQALQDSNWKERIILQLAHYRKKARFFDETNALITEILFSSNEQGIAAINFAIMKKLYAYLDIKNELIVSSKQNFNYKQVDNAGEWALRITEQMGASEYINPVSGAALFNRNQFSSSNIKLSFLKCQEITYTQRGDFEPSLSIIDVLMFSGIEGAKEQIKRYSIE